MQPPVAPVRQIDPQLALLLSRAPRVNGVIVTQPLRGIVIDRQFSEDFLRREGIPLDRIQPR